MTLRSGLVPVLMTAIAACAAVAGLYGCAGKGSYGTYQDDYDSVVYEPHYAQGFEIRASRKAPGNFLIETRNPWQGSQGTVRRLLVLAPGQKAPTGFDGQVVKAFPRRIVAMSSTYVAMLDAMGMVDAVTGVSGLRFITNGHIHAGVDTIADVGYDGNIDYEALLSARPDLVLMYATTAASTMEPKLHELGIPYMYIGEYLEELPLGKAEWLVPLSAVMGNTEAGKKAFKTIPQRYDSLCTLVAAAPGPRPSVMINTPYRDSWFMASTDSYVARLIRDAGGRYVYERNTSGSSLPIDVEEAYMLTADADRWINVGQAESLAELTGAFPRFADTRPVLTRQVYNSNARHTPGGGDDYWETGVIRPDVVLRDLIQIFHPGLLGADTSLYYYKRL